MGDILDYAESYDPWDAFGQWSIGLMGCTQSIHHWRNMLAKMTQLWSSKETRLKGQSANADCHNRQRLATKGLRCINPSSNIIAQKRREGGPFVVKLHLRYIALFRCRGKQSSGSEKRCSKSTAIYTPPRGTNPDAPFAGLWNFPVINNS